LRLHDVASDRRAIVSVDAWRLRTLLGGRDVAERDCSRSLVSSVADLSADGSTLVIGEAAAASGRPTTYLVPVNGGDALRLGTGFPLAISPSGTRVVVTIGEQLVAYSTKSAERWPLATPGPVRSARWIDDVALVAASADRVWRLSLGAAPVALAASGEAGELAIDPHRPALRVCGWRRAAARRRAREREHHDAAGTVHSPGCVRLAGSARRDPRAHHDDAARADGDRCEHRRRREVPRDHTTGG
jgi:hypothetical protein